MRRSSGVLWLDRSGQSRRIRFNSVADNPVINRNQRATDAREQRRAPENGNEREQIWPFHVVTFYWAAQVRWAPQPSPFQLQRLRNRKPSRSGASRR